jgi:putative ABC transport system permease protein
VDANFRSLGANGMQITTKHALKGDEFAPVGKNVTYQEGLDLPAAAPLVESVAMQVGGAARLRNGRAVLDTPFVGATADVVANLAQRGQLQPAGWAGGRALRPEDFLADGRFFTPAEVLAHAPVCVLGWQTAQDLFSGDDPLGAIISVNRQRCEVIGVMTELETVDPNERTRGRPNEGLVMPISTAIASLYEREPAVQITARVRDPLRMGEAKAQAAAFLRQRHDVAQDANGVWQDDFELTTRNDILGAQQAAARSFATLLAAMAAVSLIVGGIGIMNVMLVSVSERTREIGVRLAVGARGRDIVAQFLAEAALLSAVGGGLGVAVGVLAIPLAATLTDGAALLTPWSLPLALGVALLVGLVFGIYPAVRAARLDPIQALRYE